MIARKDGAPTIKPFEQVPAYLGGILLSWVASLNGTWLHMVLVSRTFQKNENFSPILNWSTKMTCWHYKEQKGIWFGFCLLVFTYKYSITLDCLYWCNCLTPAGSKVLHSLLPFGLLVRRRIGKKVNFLDWDKNYFITVKYTWQNHNKLFNTTSCHEN